MEEQIERWRLSATEGSSDAWKKTITVTLDREDLRILTDSISSANYEGVISDSERAYMFNKLNIKDN